MLPSSLDILLGVLWRRNYGEPFLVQLVLHCTKTRHRTEPPRYSKGVICALVDWSLVYVFVPSYWWLCWRDNKQRDKLAADSVGVFVPGEDVTDKQDKSFRYTT